MTEPPQRPPPSFRQRFAELSLEKKLSIFFVPVFAAVVGTLVPRFLGGESAPPPPATVTEDREDAPSENLQILDLDALNSRDKSLSYGATAGLTINVRNAGDLVSVIHAAEFDVVEFQEVELCYPPEGELPISGTYELTLPSVDGSGQSFEVDVQQQIPAGAPDSFSFDVRLDDEYTPVNGDSRLYLLHASLRHDVAESPVDAGSALLALPFPGVSQFVYPASGSQGGFVFDPECPTRNLARLQSFLALDGERSDELARFAADPSADQGDGPLEPLLEPSEEDIEEAVAVGDAFVEALSGEGAAAACRLINETAALFIEGYSDVPCAEYVEPFVSMVASGAALTVDGAHPGWVKLLGPPGDGGQLALLVQITSGSGSAPVVWEVTNLYDVAVGPLVLSGPDRSD
jgi:hypothetical protein